MANPYDPIQAAFLSVIRDFKDKLKDDRLYGEILKTTSIDEIYDATDKLQEEQAKNGRIRHLSKIEPYLERLKDYSGAIDTFVQVKPSILALIWGPIKLLIQWTSTLKQSFDAIINTTAEIGELLPEFKEVVKMFIHNVQLKDVLVLFFQDILDFYLIALKFFNKPRWQYIFESLWPRQRDKITVVITHIKRHSLLMRNEVRLEHIRDEHDLRLRALEHFEKTEKSNRQQEFHIIKTDISPKFYDDKLDWLYGRICEGTGKWLLRDSTFTKWLDVADVSTNIVWLEGIPGAGKTFLAGSVIKKAKTAGRAIFAFLSHVFSSSTSALSILHSLIFQLAFEDDDLQAALSQSSRANLKSSVTVATSLLTTFLNCAGPVYIIIDGVDEIDEIERGRLLRQLLNLSKNCKEANIMISCRPQADIREILNPASTSIRVDDHNAGSIQAFVTRQSRKWFQSRTFLSDERAEIEGLLAPVAANAKGMFLYAKVLLSSIELLMDMKSIREELKVLPENLDAAYARILARINNLPPAVTKKARNVLGWIGCSPTPLTIQELEQALIVDVENIYCRVRVASSLNVIELCGPIVEVIDEYVQFVHFTAKEYIFSPRINGFIDNTEATLSLAKCCVHYLCQSHYDPWITDDEIAENIISGDYRLHNYAATIWFELIQSYINLNGSKSLSNELIYALERLATERSSSEFNSNTELVGQSVQLELERFKDECPGLHIMLCRMAHFRQQCSSSEFHMGKGTLWTHFDPLTTYRVSMSIYTQFDELWCKASKHKNSCHCQLLERYYGQRPFKCGFLQCSFLRHGFTTKRLRDVHENHHDRPWKCAVQSCEYAQIGFLSRRMRDEHLDYYHQEAKVQAEHFLTNLDEDDIQPLLFDLIRLDEVKAAQTILTQTANLKQSVKTELIRLAASSGSAAMIQLLYNHCMPKNYQFYPTILTEPAFLIDSIQGINFETMRWILSHIDPGNLEYGINMSPILQALLKSGSLEIFEECEKYLINILDTRPNRKSQTSTAADFLSLDVIRATAGCLDRENLLLRLWTKLKMRKVTSTFSFKVWFGRSLGYVADTTCSIALAKVLLEYGGDVDARRSSLYLTPLHRAARQSSPQAAELMKFFLYQGADPELQAGRSRLKISEEKGAKELAKWLDMSWIELIQKVKLDREKGVCPPEYM